jgi:Glycogen synthase
MQSRGIKLLYGRWLIEGAPRVLLFDTGSAWSHLDEWKGDLWNIAGIPAPPSDHETNEAIVFGYLVAWFLGEVKLTLSTYSLLTRCSLCRTRRPRPSLHISTSG